LFTLSVPLHLSTGALAVLVTLGCTDTCDQSWAVTSATFRRRSRARERARTMV
jgi:hypothetical protein